MSENTKETFYQKVVIGIVSAIIGFVTSIGIESFKQDTISKYKIYESNRDKQIASIEEQLVKFYYPIYFRIQKDNAIWQLSPQLSSSNNKALPLVGQDVFESKYIIPNHDEVVSIMEKNIGVTYVDEELFKHLTSYVKHIAVYHTLRSIDHLKFDNPIKYNAPFPKGLEQVLKSRIKVLQDKHKKLLDI